MTTARSAWFRVMAAMFLLSLLLAARARATEVTFRVVVDKALHPDACTGRLVVYLIRNGQEIGAQQEPADGPFFENPQPMFGIDVKDAPAGEEIVVDDKATSFPDKPSKLPVGVYRVQVVLDMHRDDSSWRREVGNLYSDVAIFSLDHDQKEPAVIHLTLNKAITDKDVAMENAAGVEVFEMKSDLLSRFRGKEVRLRAGVVLPVDRDAKRAYPSVYEVPGFGSNHTTAMQAASMYRHVPANSAPGQLTRNAFWIVLDPEGPNGHHLFANSANNGPVGDALVQELIPALEKKYNLISQPSARLLRGHSSGGWSTLWLELQYPQVFGATWSTSPDPVDFRRFQLPDIYSQPNFYVGLTPPPAPAGASAKTAPPAEAPKDRDLPSYRLQGKELMTIRQENGMEEVLGPDNTSGQQWDSWFAVFGPRNGAGNPAALFDPVTGAIDKGVAEQYRAYDIGELLRKDPAKYGPIFRQRVRILVGSIDNYYLNEAVQLLKPEVEKQAVAGEAGVGYIKIIQGKDHGSIFASREMQSIPTEMLEHLKKAGHIPK